MSDLFLPDTFKNVNSPSVSALHTFTTEVRDVVKTVNWFYPKYYEGNIPTEMSDPRNFHKQFNNWVRTFARWIEEGSTIIDIGAFTGDTAVPLGFLAGEKGRVIAFEPHPINYSILEHNAAANDESISIDIFNKAIMLEEGEFDFLYQVDCHGSTNGGPAGNGLWTTETRAYPNPIKLESIILQDLLKVAYPNQKIDFIKVDTEGYDLTILLSLKDMIHSMKPKILMEWLPGLENGINYLMKEIDYYPLDPETGAYPTKQIADLLLLPK